MDNNIKIQLDRIKVNCSGIQELHEQYTGDSAAHSDYVNGAIKSIKDAVEKINNELGVDNET